MNKKGIELFNYIDAYIEANGFAPSYAEMVEATSISSTSNIRYYLDIMVKEGIIARPPRKARAIVIKGRP